MKLNQEIDYFITVQGTEADRKMSATTTSKYTKNLVMCLLEFYALKVLFPYRLKTV